MINLRQANINDSGFLSEFIKKLDTETRYLLYDPGERKINEHITTSFLKRISKNGKSVIFIAENENKKVVGYICGEVSDLKRLSHVMRVNIAILKEYQGQGVGRTLSEKLITYAKKIKILRIEATVIKANTISLNLCKKFGFEIEGIKKQSIKIGSEFHDEYLLSKLISQTTEVIPDK